MTSGAAPQKICVVCGTDCSTKPRYKDPEGQYICEDCYEARGEDALSTTAPGRDSVASTGPTARSGREAARSRHSGGVPRRPGSRRSFIWLFALVTLAVVVGGLGWLVFQGRQPSIQTQIQDELEALEAEGWPVTLKELNAWYAAVGENAAATYQEAFALIDAGGPGWESLPEELPMTGPQSMQVSRVVSDHQPALKLLHQAANISGARYPIDFTDGVATKLPHLMKVKRAIELLRTEALHSASNGNADRAVASVTAQLALVRSLKMEPFVISQLVRSAGWHMASDMAEILVNTGRLSMDSRSKMGAAFSDAEVTEGVLRGLVGEQVTMVHVFRNPEKEDQAVEALGVTVPTGQAREENFLYYLQEMGGLRQALRAGIDKGIAKANQIREVIGEENGKVERGQPLFFAKRFVHPLTSYPKRMAHGIAGVRVAQAGIAVARYRGAEDKLPASLEVLIPTYLDRIPVDPFDGQPLRYRQLDSGYVIYSVGEDKIDQQGDLFTPSEPADIAFHVRR